VKTKQGDDRDKRIAIEIVVDCYDEAEQMMGWYYYLEQTLEIKHNFDSDRATVR
jgi:hypothetical protein